MISKIQQNKLDSSLKDLAKNKFFLGLITISVVIGSKFIITEIPPEHMDFINNVYLRRFFMFGVFFMATRDILTSFILTVIFALCFTIFFNNGKEEQVVSSELVNQGLLATDEQQDKNRKEILNYDVNDQAYKKTL